MQMANVETVRSRGHCHSGSATGTEVVALDHTVQAHEIIAGEASRHRHSQG
jgi:hypothetical protein